MTALDRLASLAGIESGYHDIWGTYHGTLPETKVAILQSLGLPAGTPEDCEASLRELEERPWRRLAEPVTVIAAEAQPGRLTVTVPATQAGEALTWALIEEGGVQQRGHQPLDGLPLDAVRVLDGLAFERRVFELPVGLPEGYHRLTLAVTGSVEPPLETTVVVAPRRCWSPDDVASGERLWGVSCQLYALRSPRNWGLGNYVDLAELAEHAAAAGADILGLNPLHALFPAAPLEDSPYSPASRNFLNILYIDVESVPDFSECAEAQAMVAAPEFQARLAAARDSGLVDYAAVHDLTLPVLRVLHRHFEQHHLDADSDRARAYRAFVEIDQPRLGTFATFHAIQARFAAEDSERLAWWTWPEEFHDPDGPAVAGFAVEYAEEVEFHKYLQWLADAQLARAERHAEAAGMRVGLYRDLAVGVGPGSAAAWADPKALVREMSIGAPPDLLNHLGQNWGLSPLNPLTLRERAYQPFITALRANMRHAGAIRIDHAMGLMHLFWVPVGRPASEGTYVQYPLADLMRVLALESRRQRCLVIGEDLGTVPDGFRPAMSAAAMLSYRVFQFERVGDGLFKQRQAYPEDALVTAGTHDLPTLAGFWTGHDLDLRRSLDLYPSERMRDDDAANRVSDRRKLVDALIDAGLWPGGARPESDASTSHAPLPRALLLAIHRFLAGTPCRLMMVQIEDAVAQTEQQNLPGTTTEHPNWQIRLSRTIGEIFADPAVRELLRTVAEERARTVVGPAVRR